MSTLRRSTRTIAATIAAFAMVVGLAIGGPAHATEVAPPPVDDSSLTDPAPPIDTSLPGVAERIAEIEANGGEILGGSSVQYVEEGTSDDGVVARAFPSGCGLTVLIYKQTTQIVSDNPHELPRPVCERSDVLHDRFPRLGPLQQLRGQPISATHRRFEPRTGVRVQLLRQRRSDHLPHRDQRHTRQRRHHIHRGRIRHRRHPQLRNLVTQHRSTTGWAWLRPGPPLDHVQALSVRGVIGVHEQIEKMKNLILMLLGPSARELVAIPDP